MPRLFLILAGLLACACGRSAATHPAPEPGITLAIVGVNVVPMIRDTVWRGQTVLIGGGRIARIGPAGAIAVPAGVRTIDAGGGYLVPGLWDMHVHTLSQSDAFLPLFIAHGVTGVRDMGGYLDSLRVVRARLAQGLTPAPRLFAPGPLLDGPRQRWSHAIAWHLETPEQARAAVDSLARAGVDFVKVYASLSPTVYEAVAEAARVQRLPFAGHVPLSVSAAAASDAGQATLEHGGLDITVGDCAADARTRSMGLLGVWGRDGYGPYLQGKLALLADRDPACAADLYARYRRNGTHVVPTMVNELKDSATVDWPALQYADSASQAACRGTVETFHQADAHTRRDYYAVFVQDVGALHRAGVPLLAGTDVPNPCVVAGASLHGELERLVQAGLTPYQALRAATADAARFLGVGDSLGIVAEGAAADLVLLDANPLADIRNTRRIRLVMRGGTVYDRATLDSLLSRAHAR